MSFGNAAFRRAGMLLAAWCAGATGALWAQSTGNTDPRQETLEADWVARLESPRYGSVVVTRAQFHGHLLRQYARVFRAQAGTTPMVLPEILNGLSLPMLREEVKTLLNRELLERAMLQDETTRITDERLDERLNEDRDRVQRNYKGQFSLEEILARQGSSLAQYRADLRVTLWLEESLKAKVNANSLRAFFLKWREHYSGKMAYVAQLYLEAYTRQQLLDELEKIEDAAPKKPPQRREWWEKRRGAALQDVQKRWSRIEADVRRTSFADVTRQHSDDKSTSESGGVIGWVRMKGGLRQELLDVIFATKAGAQSKPVLLESSTGAGFHVFWVYQVYEPRDLVQLADHEEAVRQDMLRDLQLDYLKSLRDKATISYNLGEKPLPEGLPPAPED